MTRMTKDTRLTPTEVLARASAFFGKGGAGLEEKAMNPCCASFEGGGGYVGREGKTIACTTPRDG
jgi:hypothetical protein